MNRKYYLGEIWLPIKGYEGKYDVSNYGRVRCHDYRKKGEVRILKTTAQLGSYVKVALRGDDGKFKYYRIHRLVAQAFLGNPRPEQTQVQHLDSNKRNNYVNCRSVDGQIVVNPEGTNLEWATPKANMSNEDTRRKISLANRNPSPEVRARMSAGQLRRFARERATKTGRYAPSRV